MENVDVVQILKVGLPGLVFLLSLLSYHLLTKEQVKSSPNVSMLKSIRHFGYLNLVLAILTVIAPILDQNLIETRNISIISISAKADGINLATGNAAVCVDTTYANRNLLIKDVETSRAIQVFSRSVIPCSDQAYVSLAPEDAAKLGWDPGKTTSIVEMVPAAPGQMFVL